MMSLKKRLEVLNYLDNLVVDDVRDVWQVIDLLSLICRRRFDHQAEATVGPFPDPEKWQWSANITSGFSYDMGLKLFHAGGVGETKDDRIRELETEVATLNRMLATREEGAPR